MKSLLLLNGSPRGECSNSMKMLARIIEGWEQGGGHAPTVLHLARQADFEILTSSADSRYHFPMHAFSRNICLLLKKTN